MDLLRRLDWPQVALILGLAALAVVVIVYGPAELRAPLASLLVVLAGAARSFLGGPPAPPPPAPPPPPDDDERRPRRPLRVEARRLSLALALLVLPGCGASALQTHATIAVSMEAGLGVSRGLIAPACDVALTACHGDQACIDGAAHDCRSAVAAWEVTHAAVIGYVEALQAASLADEGAVLDALAMVLATTARTWAATVAALATVGVTLPSIPDAAAPLLAAMGAR